MARPRTQSPTPSASAYRSLPKCSWAPRSTSMPPQPCDAIRSSRQQDDQAHLPLRHISISTASSRSPPRSVEAPELSSPTPMLIASRNQASRGYAKQRARSSNRKGEEPRWRRRHLEKRYKFQKKDRILCKRPERRESRLDELVDTIRRPP